MNESQRERYQRNILVEGFGEEAQDRLLRARVCVVGAGGLGSAVLSYIVAAGVGNVTIIEDDAVSLSNLQRQTLYTTAELGQPKAGAAAARLSRLNPGCRIETVTSRLDAAGGGRHLAGHDLIADCTDNYATRYAIDDFCALNSVPMVYGTAEQAGGQVSVFHYAGAGGYRDIYPVEPEQKEVVGVLSPVVGIIGSIQAAEIIKILTGLGQTLAGRLLTVDALTMAFSEFAVPRAQP